MQNAGFPVTLVEQPGDHYDDDDNVNNTGTDNDLRHYLLPHINDGWLSPVWWEADFLRLTTAF